MNPIINMVVRRLANALLRWFMRRQGMGGAGGAGGLGGLGAGGGVRRAGGKRRPKGPRY